MVVFSSLHFLLAGMIPHGCHLLAHRYLQVQNIISYYTLSCCAQNISASFDGSDFNSASVADMLYGQHTFGCHEDGCINVKNCYIAFCPYGGSTIYKETAKMLF